MLSVLILMFFFFNDTATTEIYTLSLHDALPIFDLIDTLVPRVHRTYEKQLPRHLRSEEHTSELQSRLHLVCRLLLEKKKKKTRYYYQTSSTMTQRITYHYNATMQL